MKKAQFFLFGDSHTGAIVAGCREIGLYFGRAMKAARSFDEEFFTVENGTLTILDAETNRRLSESLIEIGCVPNLLEVDLPIVCSLGFRTVAFAKQFLRSGF